MLKPNMSLLDQLHDPGRFDIEFREEVNVKKLDSLFPNEDVENFDFMKIYTQGSELDILKGGEKLIKDTTIGLEVEVEFHELYEKQPLFRDVDSYIASNFEFQLIDLRKTYWKPKGTEYIGSPKGQLMFGDALYFRTPESLFKMCSRADNKEIAKNIIYKAIIIALVYCYFDYAVALLSRDEIKNYFTNQEISTLKKTIIKDSKGFNLEFIIKRRIPKLYQFFSMFARFLYPSYKGGGYSRSKFGISKKIWFI